MGKNILGLIFFFFVLVVSFGPTIYGAYLAFSASIILGVIMLVLMPSMWLVGVVGLFKPEICEVIAKWIGFPI